MRNEAAVQANKKLSRETIPPLIHSSLHPPWVGSRRIQDLSQALLLFPFVFFCFVFFTCYILEAKKRRDAAKQESCRLQTAKGWKQRRRLNKSSELSDNLFWKKRVMPKWRRAERALKKMRSKGGGDTRQTQKSGWKILSH